VSYFPEVAIKPEVGAFGSSSRAGKTGFAHATSTCRDAIKGICLIAVGAVCCVHEGKRSVVGAPDARRGI
jgi:hypothetical protein